jgi:hypothetical protein
MAYVCLAKSFFYDGNQDILAEDDKGKCKKGCEARKIHGRRKEPFCRYIQLLLFEKSGVN